MSRQGNEAAIRDSIEMWTDAICRGDMDRIIADRADDILMFDVPEPLQARGIEAYRQTWALFFAQNAAGPDRFRIDELNIEAGEQVAFAHGLLTIGGGDAQCRLTLGLRRREGRWQVVHEHHSMPLRLE
jgi:ketosteroid isomerase-like protein